MRRAFPKPRRALLLATLAATTPALAAAADEAPAGRLLFALEDAHRVAAYTPEGEVLASAPTGLRPRTLLRLSDGRIVVSNRGRDAAPGSSLTLLGGDDLRPLETIAACNGCAPTGLHVDAAGRLFLGAQHHKAIQVFDGAGGPALRTLLTPWGWPGEIAPLPWGEGVAIGFRDTREIGFIDLDEARPRRLAVEIDPSELAPRPGHEELWVGTRTGRLAVVVPDEASFARVDALLVVERPLDLAFEPDGRRIFGASALSPNVWFIDAETRQPAGSIPLEGSVAHLLRFSPDGGHLAIALFHRPLCLVYDVSVEGEPRLVSSFALPVRPRDMIWVPD